MHCFFSLEVLKVNSFTTVSLYNNPKRHFFAKWSYAWGRSVKMCYCSETPAEDWILLPANYHWGLCESRTAVKANTQLLFVEWQNSLYSQLNHFTISNTSKVKWAPGCQPAVKPKQVLCGCIWERERERPLHITCFQFTTAPDLKEPFEGKKKGTNKRIICKNLLRAKSCMACFSWELTFTAKFQRTEYKNLK